MYIKSIHIDSFGALRDRDFDFSSGLNIIRGENESGKSTLAMFIKFMLYGLSAKTAEGTLSERQKYISWHTGTAAGTMTVVAKDGEYKIERELFCHGDGEAVRERLGVFDTATGEKVFKKEIPGAALLGMPEQIFVNTAFIKQLGGKVDGSGLAVSIENLLMTGDESLSTKKAIDKLEKVRVSLQHKTGGGGRINDLLREAARLRGELSEAEKTNSETILLEAGVGELEGNVREREECVKECEMLLDARNKIKKYRELEDARRLKEEIHETDETIAGYGGYGNISEKIREIDLLSAQINKSGETLRTLRRRETELDEILPPAMDDRDMENARYDILIAEKCEKKKGKRIGFGIVLMLLCAAAVTFDLMFVKAPNHIYVLGGAGVLLLLGFFLLFSGISKARTYKHILRFWDAENAAHLKKVINETLRLSEDRVNPSSEYGTVLSSIKAEEDKKYNDTIALREKCSLFTAEVHDTDLFAANAVEEAKRLSSELDALRTKRGELFGKYSVLEGIFGNDNGESVEKNGKEALMSEAGKRAEEMSDEEAEEAARKKSFAEGTLPQLRERLADRKTRLGILRATTANPAEIAARLYDTETAARALTAKFEAVVAATDALRRAGENIRRNLLPRISEEAGRLSANYTHGKYPEINVSRNFELSVEADGKTRVADFLSEGTKDLEYICLRSALLHVLFEKDMPPAIYDESFSGIDRNRITRILMLLSTVGSENQSLVFTCRDLEGDISESLDAGCIIELE